MGVVFYPTVYWQATQPVSIAATVTIAGTVAVSNFPATQPVSGSVAVSNFPATQPISAVSLPLPTGAALDTSVNGILLAPGTVFVAQPGPIVQGVVAAANPAPTAGQLAPISITTSGLVRVQSQQGANTGTANAWWFKITDTAGNGPVAVKPASTAAVAADPALVVALSPNNTPSVTESTGALPALLANEQANIVPLLIALLTEMRVQNTLLASALNFQDNLDAMRADPYFSQSIIN